MSTRVRVAIAVFRGDPLDYQMYRHTALYFRFENREDPVMIHATGSEQDYVVEARQDYDPETSAHYAGGVDVGYLDQPMTKAGLIGLAYQTQPDNRTAEYNCQTWVQQALKNFQERGYLSQETYDSAVDSMLDITLEAADG